MYYIPVAVFAVWALVSHRSLPSLRDAAIVTRPDSGVWSPGRFLRDAEWTERGRAVRWQYVRSMGVGLVLFVAALIVVGALEHQD